MKTLTDDNVIDLIVAQPLNRFYYCM